MIAAPAAKSLGAFAAQTPPVAIVIGPEGGFTEAQLSLAVDKRIVPVHLGPRVLRANGGRCCACNARGGCRRRPLVKAAESETYF